MTERAVVDTLTQAGFENVSADVRRGALIVSYENRVYRYELRGLQQVILRSLPLARDVDTVTIIPRNQDVPLVAVSIPVSWYEELAAGRITSQEFASGLDIQVDIRPFQEPLSQETPSNRSFGHVDLIAQPGIAFEFGNFDDPVESQLNIIPELQARLWPGSSLRAQLILPLQNELGAEGDYVRPGLVTLNHTHRLPYNVFVGATAGYFTHNRWGLDLAARTYFLNGRGMVGADVGYTGYLSYQNRTWFYEDLNVWTPSAIVGYRVLPQYDLDVRVSYGRFLFQDLGFRVEVERAFGETQILLFAVAGEGSSNVGFAISIPFLGSRYARPGIVRFRPARSIGYSYRYKNLPLSGLWYETGHDLDRFAQNLNPDFIRNHLGEVKGWPEFSLAPAQASPGPSAVSD